MARRPPTNEAPLHVQVLQIFEGRVRKRRENHLEEMAKGLPPEVYLKLVGRAAECHALIDELEDMLTRIRKDELEIDEE